MQTKFINYREVREYIKEMIKEREKTVQIYVLKLNAKQMEVLFLYCCLSKDLQIFNNFDRDLRHRLFNAHYVEEKMVKTIFFPFWFIIFLFLI